jgi:hypothetical protein
MLISYLEISTQYSQCASSMRRLTGFGTPVPDSEEDLPFKHALQAEGC